MFFRFREASETVAPFLTACGAVAVPLHFVGPLGADRQRLRDRRHHRGNSAQRHAAIVLPAIRAARSASICWRNRSSCALSTVTIGVAAVHRPPRVPTAAGGVFASMLSTVCSMLVNCARTSSLRPAPGRRRCGSRRQRRGRDRRRGARTKPWTWAPRRSSAARNGAASGGAEISRAREDGAHRRGRVHKRPC